MNFGRCYAQCLSHLELRGVGVGEPALSDAENTLRPVGFREPAGVTCTAREDYWVLDLGFRV